MHGNIKNTPFQRFSFESNGTQCNKKAETRVNALIYRNIPLLSLANHSLMLIVAKLRRLLICANTTLNPSVYINKHTNITSLYSKWERIPPRPLRSRRDGSPSLATRRMGSAYPCPQCVRKTINVEATVTRNKIKLLGY